MNNNLSTLTATGNLSTISTEGYSTNMIYSTPQFYNYNSTIATIYSLSDLYSYFTEDELKNMIKIVLERSTNEDFKKEFIRGVIISRHFSEDFLIEYLDYVSESEVRAFHAADLNSNKYSRVKLFYELKK